MTAEFRLWATIRDAGFEDLRLGLSLNNPEHPCGDMIVAAALGRYGVWRTW